MKAFKPWAYCTEWRLGHWSPASRFFVVIQIMSTGAFPQAPRLVVVIITTLSEVVSTVSGFTRLLHMPVKHKNFHFSLAIKENYSWMMPVSFCFQVTKERCKQHCMLHFAFTWRKKLQMNELTTRRAKWIIFSSSHGENRCSELHEEMKFHGGKSPNIEASSIYLHLAT